MVTKVPVRRCVCLYHTTFVAIILTMRHTLCRHLIAKHKFHNAGLPLTFSCSIVIAPEAKSRNTCTVSLCSCSDSRANSCCVSASCCTDSASSSSERETVARRALPVCCSCTLRLALCTNCSRELSGSTPKKDVGLLVEAVAVEETCPALPLVAIPSSSEYELVTDAIEDDGKRSRLSSSESKWDSGSVIKQVNTNSIHYMIICF